jgi:deoxyribose-phosphate aldolase
VNDTELGALAEEIVARVLGRGAAVAGRRGGPRAARAGGRKPAPAIEMLEIQPRAPLDTVRLPRRAPDGGLHRVADFVDHTLLKAEATKTEIERLCAEAREFRFAAVCVNSTWVPMCAKRLAGTDVAVASVVGFPLGAMSSAAKAAEAREAVASGADEIDMVAQIGRLKSGGWACVEDDIRAVVAASRPALVKVIIESAVLSPEEIVKASAIAAEAGAHFVKTSTGFHPAGGASVEAVRLMRLAVGDALGVKAAGGIRDCATALAMLAAGANRLGTSSGVAFVRCIGPGPVSFAELLADPRAHATSCASAACRASGDGELY